jgi:hypothetical protein
MCLAGLTGRELDRGENFSYTASEIANRDRLERESPRRLSEWSANSKVDRIEFLRRGT